MIGCTKLLCGTATVSDIIKYGGKTDKLPPNMLQFSSENTPVVVWNMTARCNLACRHCYLEAGNDFAPGELTTAQARLFIDDLAKMGVPVLLFSGGEPLLREDVFTLGRYATKKGLRTVLSTNGTLITPKVAEKLREAGFQYIGISLDGTQEIHDTFRGKQGAFAEAMAGIRNSIASGNKTGIRFTINKLNYHTLPEILDIVEQERLSRFCMYHLVYAGRAKNMADLDITKGQKRATIQLLIDKALDFYNRKVQAEILTTDNHADGVYILQYIKKYQPERVQEVQKLLQMHGGCSAGKKMANVDPEGNVHACQFWGHQSLGNILKTPFHEIWLENPLDCIAALRNKSQNIGGRCAQCSYTKVCGGCRIRAEAMLDNVWAEDPACYLTDEEVFKA